MASKANHAKRSHRSEAFHRSAKMSMEQFMPRSLMHYLRSKYGGYVY